MLLWLLACAPPATEVPPGVVVVSREQQGAWVRNFNPFIPGARWPTTAGIYEPLLIFRPLDGVHEPWLATEHSWLDNAQGLRFVIRDGVQWSDGTPLTVDDVVFTFQLLLNTPALDTGGLRSFVQEAVATDEHTVEIHFTHPYSPGLDRIAHVPIVPAHIWSTIEQPVTFANPEPVGSGPFTEVLRFETQLWELGKNPHYWQEGRPAVDALRFPAISSNEQAALALINGDVDWAGNFIPAIDRIFVEQDPEHHQYWFPQAAGAIYLFANTTRPPMDDPAIRRALSLAIDRELIVDVAMYGYTQPAPPLGLSDGYAQWRSADIENAVDWVQHDPERAAQILDAAGYTLADDGMRYRNGEPLVLTFQAVAGWSDWIRASQVIRQSMETVGITVNVQGADMSAWMERVSTGEFDLTLGWAPEGTTPYDLYTGLMDERAVLPVGEAAQKNWHRLGDPAATALLQAFEQTADRATQQQLIEQLQSRYAELTPAIPVFLNPSWGECSTRRITGFPGPDDPYARLSPNHDPEALLVMTRLEPR